MKNQPLHGSRDNQLICVSFLGLIDRGELTSRDVSTSAKSGEVIAAAVCLHSQRILGGTLLPHDHK